MAEGEVEGEVEGGVPTRDYERRRRRWFLPRVLHMEFGDFIHRIVLGRKPEPLSLTSDPAQASSVTPDEPTPPALPPAPVPEPPIDLQLHLCPVCKGRGHFDEDKTLHPKCLTCEGSGKFY